MITGILTFKPLDNGKRLQVVIEVDNPQESIMQVAPLFGQKVRVTRDTAEVMPESRIILGNIHDQLDGIRHEVELLAREAIERNLDDITADHIIAWADGVRGALGTEHAGRITEKELALSIAIVEALKNGTNGE
jgi:hypothetical protein